MEIVDDDIYGLRSIWEPVRTVIDVGANIGVFSIFAKLQFSTARVIAVEPGETAFRFLSMNVSALNVEKYACAVGAEIGPGSLIISNELTTARLCDGPIAGTSQHCQIVTLESIVQTIDAPVDVLKLDCEGAEYDIFGSPGLNAVRRIRAELHSGLKGSPQSGLQQLHDRGFVVTKWAPFPGGAAGIVWADKPTR